METGNIATLLAERASAHPEREAVRVLGRGHQARLNFQALDEEANRLAGGLVHAGVRPGHRMLLMVRPGIELLALTFALFRLGALPVLIDPGLGRRNLLSCIRHTQPQGLIGIPLAHAARSFFRSAFGPIKVQVTVGRRWFWGGLTLDQVRRRGTPHFSSAAPSPDDPAAILFTSGSTGPPKGVVYTHAMFFHQVQALQALYDFRPGEVDLPTFPLFALFGVALGMTCLIPEMDPTRPARVHPPHIIEPIQEFQVSNSFGSPALWDTVTHFCLQHGVKLPSLKRVLLAGAPVPGPLLARFDQILSPEARVFTPYGATEALPVSNIEKREILDVTWARTEQGAGTCVGRPVPGLRVHILPLSDAPIDAWDPGQDLPPGGRGEIAVEAPWVTRDYFQMEKTTRAAKVLKEGGFLHRMGDVGYFDGQGRLWFCGRKNHRVLTPDGPLFTIPCEAVFNRHPAVQRTALVGVGPPGSQKPVLIVELRMPGPSKKKRMALEDEILALGKDHPHTRNIQCVLFHAAFPVDVRHNAKISREVLARWAEKQCAL